MSPRIYLYLIVIGLSWAVPLSAQSTGSQVGLENLSASFEALAERVTPAMVQIVAMGYDASQEGVGTVAPRRAGGSGVILNADGYIVTNAHVVAGALNVQVRLALPQDQKEEWRSILKPRGSLIPAKIVGIDRETDLAVLKVDYRGLPTLELGDSESLRQGQLVLAFGSPLGLENSVSMGIVSSVARQLRPEDPMIYIQTDAPINPGSSGGPLVDTRGRVVGINTFILSQSGGNEGLGFAAPSNIVRNVFDQIRKEGRVRRGYLGVEAQTITPAMAAGLRLPAGALVILNDVLAGAPADRGGLKIGDVILRMNGKIMENARQFRVNVYQRAIGDAITLETLRGSEKFTREIVVGERPDDPERFLQMVKPDANLVGKLGILGLDLDPKILATLPPMRKPAGVLVAGRVAGSSQPEEGLSPGDLIISLNGEPVTDLAGLRETVARLKSGDAVVFQIQRLERLTFIAFNLE
jgi:serine protease Do